MASVHGPTLADGAITRYMGCVQRLVGRYVVKDVSGATLADKLNAVYTALEAVGLEEGVIPTVFPDLMISNIDISSHPAGQSTWNAEITFLNLGELEGLGIFSTTCSMTSATSMTDYNGLPITVSYTFPADYILNPAWAGESLTQGVQVNVMLPTREMTASKLVTTPNVNLLEMEWIGRLNTALWRGNPRGTVMCTNVSHKLARRQKSGEVGHTYLMQFSFQWLGRGHQPKVQFVDPNTGAPPADLVLGTGYYTMNGIEKLNCFFYPYLDFSTLFPGS